MTGTFSLGEELLSSPFVRFPSFREAERHSPWHSRLAFRGQWF